MTQLNNSSSVPADDQSPQNRIIDLNTADEATLAGLAMVGPKKARRLVEHRPYRDWREVEKVPDIGPGTVDVLAMAGVQISRRKNSKGS